MRSQKSALLVLKGGKQKDSNRIASSLNSKYQNKAEVQPLGLVQSPLLQRSERKESVRNQTNSKWEHTGSDAQSTTAMALPWDHLHLPYSPGLTPLVPRIPLGVKVQFSSAGPLNLFCEFFLHQIMNTTNQKPTTRRPVELSRLGSRGQDISACLCCSGHKVVRATA